jgi:hypothetical protein
MRNGFFGIAKVFSNKWSRENPAIITDGLSDAILRGWSGDMANIRPASWGWRMRAPVARTV